jgi:polyferredoxin
MKSVSRILGVLFVFFIAVVLSANMHWNFFFFEWIKYIPFGDKMAHFLLVGTLTLFVNLLFEFKNPFSSFYLKKYQKSN